MDQAGTSRRTFLTFLTDLLLAVLGVLILIPVVRYVFAPLWQKSVESEFVDVGRVADIPAGQWQLLPLELVQADGWHSTRTRHAVWVRRQGSDDRDITVFSPICPHLGCPVNWVADKSQFNCPCHGGLFTADGKQTAGPPPRGMDTLEHKVQGGRLLVRWEDFKIGAPAQIPVTV
jgi:menaquinol-cytochrome c reductase iron-sulfur subunit